MELPQTPPWYEDEYVDEAARDEHMEDKAQGMRDEELLED